jgi:hypothetical protein
MFETVVDDTTAMLQGLVTASEKSDVPVNVVIAIPFRVADAN